MRGRLTNVMSYLSKAVLMIMTCLGVAQIPTEASWENSETSEFARSKLICDQLQDKADAVNASGTWRQSGLFASFQIKVDCPSKDYLLEFGVDETRVPALLESEEYVRSTFFESVCRDPQLWERAFADG